MFRRGRQGSKMSVKPRVWPNVAREARDRAAEEAVKGIRYLRPVVRGERCFTETDRLRHLAVALSALTMIAWLMQSQGAPIRPDFEDE